MKLMFKKSTFFFQEMGFAVKVPPPTKEETKESVVPESVATVLLAEVDFTW